MTGTAQQTTPPIASARAVGSPRRQLGLVGLALGGCLLVNLVDPNEPGALGLCPFKAMTGGLDCPGCGVLRATRAITRGNLVLAADHNLLAVLVAPVLVVMLVSAWRAERGVVPRRWSPPAQVTWAIAIATPVFWVVRNLPFASWLASAPA